MPLKKKKFTIPKRAPCRGECMIMKDVATRQAQWSVK